MLIPITIKAIVTHNITIALFYLCFRRVVITTNQVYSVVLSLLLYFQHCTNTRFNIFHIGCRLKTVYNVSFTVY